MAAYHKLLERQIAKLLPADLAGTEALQPLLDAVSKSYQSYDRDRTLSDHAFSITECEYQELMRKLRYESDHKSRTLERLAETFALLRDNEEAHQLPEDMLEISNLLNQQVLQRKRADNIIGILMGNLQVGILLKSDADQILYVNDYFCYLFGIGCSHKDLKGKSFRSVIAKMMEVCLDPTKIEPFSKKSSPGRLAHTETVRLIFNRVLELKAQYLQESDGFVGCLITCTDISANYFTQERLRRNENWQRAVLNGALDAIVMISESRDITFWNPQAEQIFGWNQMEVIGKKLFEVIIPEPHRQSYISTANQLKRITGLPFIPGKTIEMNAVKKDGKKIKIALSIIQLEAEPGKFYCAFIQDITERKNSEYKIRESEKRLALSQAISHVGNWELRLPGTVLELSEEACRIFGNDQQTRTMSRTKLRAMIHPEDRAKYNKLLRNASEFGTAFQTHYRIVRATGEERILFDQTEVQKELDGRVIAVRAVIQDVTEARRAQQLLEAQRKFNEEILDNLPSEVIVLDNQFHIVFLNKVAEPDRTRRRQLTGCYFESYCDASGLSGAAKKDKLEKFTSAVVNKQSVSWMDELTDRNGSRRFVLRNVFPYFEGNHLKYMICYAIDLTDRRQMELDLEQALQQTRSSNIELEQFAYVASHDLQEPLRMISSFLALVQKKYQPLLDTTGNSYIDFAVNGANKMRRVILDLLEYSRVGRTNNLCERFSLADLITEIMQLHQARIEETGAQILIGALPDIYAPRTLLFQVLSNLLNNALKFTRKSVSPEITVSAVNLEGFWEISVADNGIGINPDYFTKIFQLFQRLHSTQEFIGNGIGLSISKKIVESLGGTITVTSTPGAGSCFCFTIKKRTEQPS